MKFQQSVVGKCARVSSFPCFGQRCFDVDHHRVNALCHSDVSSFLCVCCNTQRLHLDSAENISASCPEKGAASFFCDVSHSIILIVIALVQTPSSGIVTDCSETLPRVSVCLFALEVVDNSEPKTCHVLSCNVVVMVPCAAPRTLLVKSLGYSARGYVRGWTPALTWVHACVTHSPCDEVGECDCWQT